MKKNRNLAAGAVPAAGNTGTAPGRQPETAERIFCMTFTSMNPGMLQRVVFIMQSTHIRQL